MESKGQFSSSSASIGQDKASSNGSLSSSFERSIFSNPTLSYSGNRDSSNPFFTESNYNTHMSTDLASLFSTTTRG